MKLKENDLILFIGDSITNVGRNRQKHDHLGHGCPLIVSATLSANTLIYDYSFLTEELVGIE